MVTAWTLVETWPWMYSWPLGRPSPIYLGLNQQQLTVRKGLVISLSKLSARFWQDTNACAGRRARLKLFYQLAVHCETVMQGMMIHLPYFLLELHLKSCYILYLEHDSSRLYLGWNTSSHSSGSSTHPGTKSWITYIPWCWPMPDSMESWTWRHLDSKSRSGCLAVKCSPVSALAAGGGDKQLPSCALNPAPFFVLLSVFFWAD